MFSVPQRRDGRVNQLVSGRVRTEAECSLNDLQRISADNRCREFAWRAVYSIRPALH